MNNLIKLASVQLNKSTDIIRVAGILRLLKNKLFMLFDPDLARDVNKMLDSTNGIKHQLYDTYKSIKKVEDAINDLDIVEYNVNIDELKSKLNELNEAIKNVKEIIPEQDSDKNAEQQDESQDVDIGLVELPVTEKKEDVVKKREEKARGSLVGVPREYAPLPDGAKIYEGKTTLSQLGVTANDIKSNVNVRQMPASWALVAMPQTQEDQKELLSLQDALLDQDYVKKAFYNKIPNMRIEKIQGREINVVSDQYGNKGDKKPGYMEVVVVGDYEKLPEPLNDWRLKPKFVLVDLRQKPDDPLKYVIYRKYILKADKETK